MGFEIDIDPMRKVNIELYKLVIIIALAFLLGLWISW